MLPVGAERAPSAEPDPEPDALLRQAASHATADVPTGRSRDDAGSLRLSMLGGRFDSAHDVAVLDGRTLVGIVSIERLLAAPPEATLGELMDSDPPVATEETLQEHVAAKMISHGESSVAVVDRHGNFASPRRRPLASGCFIAFRGCSLALLERWPRR
jgi:magnesium transporter